MKTKHYLVVGAASGIGAEVSRRLTEAGHHVTGLDLVKPENQAIEWVFVNLAEPDTISKAAAELTGRYDGIANIAGVPGTGGSDLTLRVNFLGIRALTDALQTKLNAGSGIVNVASRAGHQWPLRLQQHLALATTDSYESGLAWLVQHSVSDNNAYPYSKEVLRVWTQLKAAELISTGLRVNVINPGPVATPILGDFRRLLGEDRMNDGITRGGGQAAQPTDIAPIITWLLSDDARWVNGADIAVDGGLAATYIETPMADQPGIKTDF